MKFTALGCGDAFASKGRHTTSFLLEAGDERLLVDCGATTLVRLKQLEVPIDTIDTIIITHFHGDHFGGVPFVILSRHFEYKHRALTLIGPKGLQDKIMTLHEALYPGTSEFYENLGVIFVEYESGSWIKHADMDIYPTEVTHSPPTNPHGVKVNWKGKTFAYSGDTSWNDSLIELADNSDLFIIECNNYENQTSGHLSYKEIMQKKERLNAKRICLTHMNSEVIGQSELEIDRLEDGMVVAF